MPMLALELCITLTGTHEQLTSQAQYKPHHRGHLRCDHPVLDHGLIRPDL